MTINKYLQLYGILDTSVYSFESIPTDSIEEVVQK